MINYIINNELNYINNKNNDIYNLIISTRNNILQSENYFNNILIKNIYIIKPKNKKKINFLNILINLICIYLFIQIKI